MPSGESGKKKVNVVCLLPNVSAVCVVKNYVRNRYGRVGVYNNNVTRRGGIRDCSSRRGVLGYIVRNTRFYFIRIFFPPLTPPGECTHMYTYVRRKNYYRKQIQCDKSDARSYANNVYTRTNTQTHVFVRLYTFSVLDLGERACKRIIKR